MENAHLKKVLTTDQWTAGLSLSFLKVHPFRHSKSSSAVTSVSRMTPFALAYSRSHVSIRLGLERSLTPRCAISFRYRSTADSTVVGSAFLGGSTPIAFRSSSCSRLRAFLVAISHDRVLADLFPFLPQRSHLEHEHRRYCPAFFSLLLGHFLECLV